ncbi:MAG: hypothetical protein ACRC9Y_17905 [Aeromonas veronii]
MTTFLIIVALYSIAGMFYSNWICNQNDTTFDRIFFAVVWLPMAAKTAWNVWGPKKG